MKNIFFILFFINIIYSDHPAIKNGCQIINHSGFTLCYNDVLKQSEWVYYKLNPELFKDSKFPRTNVFRIDRSIISRPAKTSDYVRSGYDRGHLAPASDMSWSKISMRESFLMSNISPQIPEFNRGIWKQLESQIRKWSKEKGTLEVVTGPVLYNGLPVIGDSVAVPAFFYKVILSTTKMCEYQAVGFVLRNVKSNLSLEDLMVTVNFVESITEIDFFPSLPDSIESTYDKEYWFGIQTR